MFIKLFNYLESLTTGQISKFLVMNSYDESFACTILKECEFTKEMCDFYKIDYTPKNGFFYDIDKKEMSEMLQHMTSESTICYMMFYRYIDIFENRIRIETIDDDFYHEIFYIKIFEDGSFERCNLDYLKFLTQEEINDFSEKSVFIGKTDDEVLPVCFIR